MFVQTLFICILVVHLKPSEAEVNGKASMSYSSKHYGYNCPTWFVYNNATNQCECGDDLGGIVICDSETSRIFITSCYCMTEEEEYGPIVGECFTNCYIPKSISTFKMYLHLPPNVSELNDEMCGHRWNRDGRLCGKCTDSYHPLVYSYDMKCTKCENGRYNWLKYIVAAFVPLTVFFIFIVTTGVSASSPELDAFVVYAQTIATPANVRMVLEASQAHPQIGVPTKIVATLYGIWNLDFFRTLLPPICLKISTLQALALDYFIAFYPLLLIFLTYVLIDLYDRRFRLIVWMWKPFGILCKSVGDEVNVKSSIINAFVTFIILSYVKLLSVSFDLLNYTKTYGADGSYFGSFLYYDASTSYFGQEHLPYGILAIAVSVVFILLPLLLSLLHPLHCMRRCTGKWPALRICLDSYQGYYKDGTEGTRDYRWFSALYLLARISLFVVYAAFKNSYFYSFAAIILLYLVALLILCQPFKPQFGQYNTIHALLFLNLSAWFATTTCTHMSALKAMYLHTFSFILSGVVAVLPLIYITCLGTKWICKQRLFRIFTEKLCRRYCYFWHRKMKASLEKQESADSIDSIPYRVDHPENEQVINIIASTTSGYGTFN